MTTEQKPKKRGRPSSFTQEKADDLCAHIASGKSLKSWCRQTDTPNWETVRRWLRDPDRDAFRAQYAQARRDQSDTYVERIVELSQQDHETMVDINRARLEIDSLKWVAGKQSPRVYGDRTAVDVGGQADNPVDWAGIIKKAQT